MAAENLLLARLPSLVRERLRPHLELVRLERGQCVCEAGELAQHAYFPASGLLSLEVSSVDGETLELAVVGREGMVGPSILVRDDESPCRVIVRAGALAHRIRGPALRAEMQVSGPLRDALVQQAISILHQAMHISLCHSAHNVLQRLCRWLLTAADYLDTETVVVTRESLMQALGVAHVALRKALAELQDADAIGCRRGRITIRARSRLETTACSCYKTLRASRLESPPHQVGPVTIRSAFQPPSRRS